MTILIERDLIDSGAAGTELNERPLFGVERVFGVEPGIPSEGRRVQFRLYDDDGILYYEGKLTDDDECANQMAALTWGTSFAGCTYIKVNRAGTWVQEIG